MLPSFLYVHILGICLQHLIAKIISSSCVLYDILFIMKDDFNLRPEFESICKTGLFGTFLFQLVP